jgi:hypothetical protein
MKSAGMPCLIALFLCTPSWAARPFITDDARLTTEGSCQLESWMRTYTDSREFWALPACNPGGNLEFTVGGGVASSTDGTASTDYVFQLKTLFKPLATNGWGLGVAAGRVQHPEIHPGPNQLGNTYAYLPFSASFNKDRFITHANLGWLHDDASSQDRTTWGLGGELQTSPRSALIAETFGDDKTQAYWQMGVRFFLIPNLFQIDATTGQPFGGDGSGRWISLGVRWTPERLY